MKILDVELCFSQLITIKHFLSTQNISLYLNRYNSRAEKEADSKGRAVNIRQCRIKLVIFSCASCLKDERCNHVNMQ